ncbi:hypothetical protein GJAV_G00037310 [Gymnothorax javanicus]|nr:hypothetical protein GJAV_G00037310 [Gymnothorax javanicus]
MSQTQRAESGEGPGRAPPAQRHRHANGRAGATEGMRPGWRPCQQHNPAVEVAEEAQNHHHGNQQRHRRYEPSSRGGGRTRGPRGPVQEGGAPQQQPRPGVARYRRAQPLRHKHRDQGEAELQHAGRGKHEEWAGVGVGPGGDPGPHSGLQGEVGSLNTMQCSSETRSNRLNTRTSPSIPVPASPPPSPEHSESTCNPKFSKCRNAYQPADLRMEQEVPAKPKMESNEPHAESTAEPQTELHSYTKGSSEPHVDCHRESCTEPYTGSGTESSRETDLDPHTEPPQRRGRGCEDMEGEGEWEGEWVRQTALQLRRAGMRLFEHGGLWQQRSVGSRLHHYDGGSDGESDSPEREPEVPVSPQEQDGEGEEAVLRRRRRSWSLDRALGEEGDWPESEQASRRMLGPGGHQGEIGPDMPQDEQASLGDSERGEPLTEQAFQGQIRPGETQEEQTFQRELGPDEPQDEEAFQGNLEPEKHQGDHTFQGELEPGEPQDEQTLQGGQGPGEPQAERASQDEYGPGEQSWARRDSLSLAIKDIKEAIQEVKTRTVRSPYTPEEPVEPVWVMRQDLSPTPECDLPPSLGSDSLDSGSPSPIGLETTNRQLLQEAGYSTESPPSQEARKSLASFPTYVDVPGPCDPEDLIDGIIFAANYLGSTQLLSEKTPSKSVRMTQAQEAVSRVRMAKNRKKTAEAQSPVTTEVDLFISTQRIKVLSADSQETMMDHPLRTISYIADIGDIVVLMARRKKPRPRSQELAEVGDPAQEGRSQYSDHTHDGRGQYDDQAQEERRQYRMICHVFESEDAQLIAQSIGQAFSVAYQEFLRANGIDPEDLSQREYSDLLSTQDMYNDDLIHFSKSENCKDVSIEKQKGEILGVVVVESGWGSILPTVIIANMMHGGPAERSGLLSIGDQIMSVNGTSLVGLPLTTCQSIIKGLKSQPRLKLNIVRCPPVTTVLIRRPDLRYQLGFSVQNGIICSLMRGGIAERGGVRVGHRIIEISGQSVVATPHERIVNILSSAVGEIHMKTMPAAMYRLLTGQEQPIYI